jgi:hypothetical protein
MSKEDDLLIFDEDEAVKFIYNFIPKEMRKHISEDDIDYVLDIMYDYYEKNDLIDEDSTEEASIDEEDMFNFIMNCIKKDKVVTLSEESLQIVLDGEFEYGKKIGIYTEAE